MIICAAIIRIARQKVARQKHAPSSMESWLKRKLKENVMLMQGFAILGGYALYGRD